MKQLKLLLLLIFLLAFKNTKAEETEPNNTKAQASIMHLNGADTGTFNNASDVDWWLLNTNNDGDLLITFGVTNCSDVDHNCDGFYYTIYDEDGTTVEVAATPTHLSSVIKGLIAGKYYVQVRNIHSAETNSKYILYSTLTASTNDAEPNNDFSHAIVLPLNGGKEGTVGYGNKLKRDSADWYKVTINADGLLRFTFTASKTSINLTLFDNNGTKQIAPSLNSTNGTFNNDGLAAGTYYVRVKCYNVSVYSPYTINDTLIKPAQQNDTEPNNQQSQAINLPVNKTKEGHAGYYYNLKRDSADWYKLTTNADGYLKFKFVSVNTSINITLYNKDGITQIAKSLNSTNGTLNYDGLSAGNYLVKVQCYNNAVFTPYTITDSLYAYDYASDEEPNAKPYQAKTILANGVTTGHSGFYNDNNTKDSVDWYKINYTGSGALGFTINQEPYKSNGSTTSMRFYIYKDTTASPIYSGASSAVTFTANLTGLTQGYYWMKVYSYDYVDHMSYSFSNSFTQVNIASIKPTTYDTAPDCSSVNSITFASSKSAALYTVQLYRYGAAYGNAVKTNKKVTFKNLPAGLYYATTFGDGATGSAFGKSKNVSLEPVPVSLTTTNIQVKQAKLNWANISCAAYYTIQYKVHGTTNWTIKKTSGNVNNYVLKNLSASTTYNWQVAASDSANGIIATSAYADSITFTTTSTLIGDVDNSEEMISTKKINNFDINVSTYPNPATNFFIINLKNNKQEKVNAILFDINGKVVWTSGLINADVLNGKKVMVNQFGNGIYYLKITNDKGMLLDVAKLMINK